MELGSILCMCSVHFQKNVFWARVVGVGCMKHQICVIVWREP
jgi:hypothetical protein